MLLTLLAYAYARDRIDDARYCGALARDYHMPSQCPVTLGMVSYESLRERTSMKDKTPTRECVERIVNALKTTSPLSRAELSKLTGVNPATLGYGLASLNAAKVIRNLSLAGRTSRYVLTGEPLPSDCGKVPKPTRQPVIPPPSKPVSFDALLAAWGIAAPRRASTACPSRVIRSFDLDGILDPDIPKFAPLRRRALSARNPEPSYTPERHPDA